MNDPNLRLPDVPSFTLASPDFTAGGRLPQSARAAYAGGEDRSPALEWSGQPDGTKSYVLTCYDPDAPTGSGYWHWTVQDIPGGTTSLPAGAGTPSAGLLPGGAVVHPTDSGNVAFEGAAPPAGDGEHRYFFTLSALDVEHLEVPPTATPAIVGFMLRAHLLARAQLVGTTITEG